MDGGLEKKLALYCQALFGVSYGIQQDYEIRQDHTRIKIISHHQIWGISLKLDIKVDIEKLDSVLSTG